MKNDSSKIAKNGFLMLQAHYESLNREISETKLAQAAGYEDYQVANSQYGKFASKVCDLLSYKMPDTHCKTNILAIEGSKDQYGHLQWKLRPEVAEALEQLGFVKNTKEVQEPEVNFEDAVTQALQDSPEKLRQRLANANRIPQTRVVQQTVFIRNPCVAALVLLRTNGVCERCGCDAPFLRANDGTPYLEVHHIQQLAHGGEDSEENAIALCPNCHRELHYGMANA